MEDPGRKARRRRLAQRALAGHAAGAAATGAGRAYDALAQVLAPVIGDVGVAAMTDRALHLVAREYPWLPASEPGSPDTSFTKVVEALKRQDDPAVATEAAAAVLEAILGLLATFIGEPLAARLVKQAWPDAVSSTETEET